MSLPNLAAREMDLRLLCRRLTEIAAREDLPAAVLGRLEWVLAASRAELRFLDVPDRQFLKSKEQSALWSVEFERRFLLRPADDRPDTLLRPAMSSGEEWPDVLLRATS